MTTPLEAARNELRTSAAYGRLRTTLGRATGLPVPAAAWVMDCLAEDLERSFLVVLPLEASASEWLDAAQSLGGRSSTVYFAAPSLTPYQATEVSLAVRAHEVVALDRLYSGERVTVVCAPRALFRRLPTRAQFRESTIDIAVGQDHPIEELSERLVRSGYYRTDLVAGVGEFAVRGGVFDFFPPGLEEPVRLDLFGDTVESIRVFEPESQRSHDRVERVRALPLDLFPSGAEARTRLAEVLAERLAGDEVLEEVQRLNALEAGETFPGWQNYLPLLGESEFLAAALPESLVVVVAPEAVQREVDHFADLLQSQFENRLGNQLLAVPPEDLVFSRKRVRECISAPALTVCDFGDPAGTSVDFGASSTDILHSQLARFPREVETARSRGDRLLLLAPQEHHERIREALGHYELSFGSKGVELVDAEIQRGFRFPPTSMVLFSEAQLFAQPAGRTRRRSKVGAFFSGLRDLKVGDFLVHAEHGVGQLVGLRALERAEEGDLQIPRDAEESRAALKRSAIEVMEIRYAGEKILLLPLSRLDQVQKYHGLEGVAPRLDTLGGTSWKRTKSRIRKSVRDMAERLLQLYAQRQLAEAPAMLPDSDLQHQFEAAFEFDETEDQLSATRAIKEDLESTRPMDRLLCGDVGFGKTEVAMRAAIKVVDSGYQVAVLAPTTILADQHLETFRRRLSEFPIRVDMVSRFRSGAEMRKILQDVREQRVDILIGTHRLLSKKTQFKRLGLLIIDEEQRFGVAQKERIKELRKDVHVLAMSATPVPRTLQLSIAGVRDLSLIESPPKDRMAVETQILPFSDELIREAIEFEIERGGQVYYVHNRVASIDRVAADLQKLVPDARITVGHGQLDERELSKRMHAFIRREYDVLVASTIIENGIDIPNVNTMFVHRADRFGLAQLYQLRGRVGRSHHLAYCYLLIPEDRLLSQSAQRRLSAIREFTELGAGFRVAARDLEIRGAGNLLGAEQSGHISELGIETYLKMLEQTVSELKGEAPPEAPSASIELPVDMTIPEDYVGDTNLRMGIYRRFGSSSESGAEVLAELEDRFGPPPASVRTLAAVADLKRLAERLRVQSISFRRGKLVIRLREDAKVDVDELIRLVSTRSDASFSPSGVLSLQVSSASESIAVASAALTAVET